jgi:hypothetical protein
LKYLGGFGELVEGPIWRVFGPIFLARFGAVSRDYFCNFLGCFWDVFGGD